MQAAAGASLTPEGDAPVADVSAPTAPRRLGLLVGTALTAWSLDVVTKIVAVEALGSRTEPVTLVPAVLDLTLTRNPGAAFSVATSMTAVLTVVAFGVVAVVLRLAVRVRGRLWALAFGLLLGGALGNLTDRMLRSPGPFRGHVVDFLRLPHWPVFNLADSCIVVAAVLIAWQSLRGVPLEGGTSTAAVDDDHR